MKISAKDIAIVGVSMALIAVMTFVPFLGFIPIIPGVIDMTLLLIPVIVVCQKESFISSLLIGTFFGAMSCVNAFTMNAGSLLAPLFQNPLISVLPRICVGVTTHFSYVGLKKLCKNANSKFLRDILPCGLSAVVGVVTNTALVVGSWPLWVAFYEIALPKAVYITVLSGNFVCELVACLVFVPTIVLLLNRVVGKSRGKVVSTYDEEMDDETYEETSVEDDYIINEKEEKKQSTPWEF